MEKFNGDHGKCMGGAGLLTEAQYKVIADRMIEEHRKYVDRLGPGHWADVAARKVASQMVEFSVGERVFTESEVMAFIADLKLEYAFHSASEVVDRVARRLGFLDPVHAHPPKEEQQAPPGLTVDKAIEAVKGWVMSVAECKDETEWNDRHWQKVVSDLRARLEQAAKQ